MTTSNSKPKVEVLPDEASTPFDDKANDNSDSDNSNSDSNSNNSNSDNSKKEKANQSDLPIDENSKTIKTMQIVYAKQYIAMLKSKTNQDAIAKIDTTSISDTMLLGQLLLDAKAKKWIKNELGEEVGNYLIHMIASKLEAGGREFDSSRRIQSLEEETEGCGLYAQRTPYGTVGAEIGVCVAAKQNDKLISSRIGLGMYINMSATCLHMEDPELSKKLSSDMDDLLNR